MLCEVLCNAFFARTKCWKGEEIDGMSGQGYDIDLWPHCRYHLYAGVLCMYACVVMEKLFEGVHDEYMAKLYHDNRSAFEQRTVSLLNDIFRENASIALNVLEIDYEHIFKLGEEKFFDGRPALKRAYTRPRHAETCWGGCCRVRTPWSIRSDEASIELMAVAFRAQAMEFLAHNCCQSLIERRWHGRLRLSPTRALISYFFPCFIYKEFAMRKTRGPELRKNTRTDAANELNYEMKSYKKKGEKLLAKASKNPVFSNTVDLDSQLIIPSDALTPNSADLDLMQRDALLNSTTADVSASNASKHMMRCHAPRFPVKEDARSLFHYSPIPSPSVTERVAQSTVFPVEEAEREDDSMTYDPFEVLPHHKKRKPIWLWSTLDFYSTTKAKFVYHVAFRILYVMLYSWVLVAKPRRRSSIPRFENYWEELLVALVQLSQLCDCIVAIRERMPPAKRLSGPWVCHVFERYDRKVRRIRMGFFEWTSEHLFAFYRNSLIITNFIFASTLLIRARFVEGELVYAFYFLYTPVCYNKH
ncbi:hypothetical protein OESDEN_04221 [Oesophagostomum dentatum]|uniref:Uncharacterized protein n=1 Tax=Oesophagostomum dentatum TaxID=61180 RepID=A0A0B1TE45_OESDE|nr:hypothetical protein OESDEN_04221 [Oesophagostomum dentatum]